MYVDAFIKINLDFNFRTLIKGDNRINAIKLASVIAKVTRDRRMVKLHKQIKEYGFDRHKGYGTFEHLRMLKKYGPSKVHRLTFLKH
jgi:ribonuclease HII